MDKEKFIESIRKTKPADMRLGQAIFNTCTNYFPKRTEEARGTNIDPFHRDDKINDFLDYVMKGEEDETK